MDNKLNAPGADWCPDCGEHKDVCECGYLEMIREQEAEREALGISDEEYDKYMEICKALSNLEEYRKSGKPLDQYAKERGEIWEGIVCSDSEVSLVGVIRESTIKIITRGLELEAEGYALKYITAPRGKAVPPESEKALFYFTRRHFSNDFCTYIVRSEPTSQLQHS